MTPYYTFLCDIEMTQVITVTYAARPGPTSQPHLSYPASASCLLSVPLCPRAFALSSPALTSPDSCPHLLRCLLQAPFLATSSLGSKTPAGDIIASYNSSHFSRPHFALVTICNDFHLCGDRLFFSLHLNSLTTLCPPPLFFL